MASIGWASLQIVPTMSGIAGQISSGIAGPVRAAGVSAGTAAGQGVASGIAAAKGAVDKAVATLAKSQDKLADASGKVSVAQAQLSTLQEKGVTDAGRLAAATERVEAAKRKEAAASKDAEKAAANLAAAEERAANATDDVAESAEKAGGGFKGMFSGLDSGVKKLAAVTAGAAGVAGAVDLMNKRMEQEADFSKMNASMGATGELAKEYGAAAGSLYASGLGDSMGEVTAALGTVQSTFHTLGSEGEASMEEVTTRAMNFANVFDTDVSTAVQTASQLVNNGLAKDSTEAFDMMTKSFQTVPAAMREELPAILDEYGTNFRALGIEGPEAFNMLIGAAEGGAIVLDKTGDALKEFTIRGADMSKSSVDTFKAIGLSGEDMAKAIATGGADAQVALQKTANGLLEIKDPVERANAAIALFGSPLEDLSVDQIPGFLTSLTGAENAMGDFSGATDEMGAILNDNAMSKMDTFKRGIEQNITNVLGENVIPLFGEFTGALEENEGSMLGAVVGMAGLGGAVAGFETAKGTFDSVKEGAVGLKDGFMEAKGTATELAGGVKDGMKAVKDFDVASKLSSATTKIWSGIQLVFNAIMSANPLMLIVIGIGLLVAAVVLIATKTTWFQTIWDAVWGGITATWDWVWNKLQIGWELLKSAFGAIGDKVTEVKDWIVGKWNELVDFITGIPGRVAAIASGMWTSVTDTAGSAKDWVVGKFDELVGFVTGLPGRITSAVGGMFDGIKNTFKSALNWIIQKWNDFSFSLKVPDSVPFFGGKGFTINTPDIPYLATGGVAGRRKDGTLWGPGTGTSDSILGVNELGIPTAFVGDGEGVVKYSAMQGGGAGLVAALNAGWTPSAATLHMMFPDLPGYVTGGVVGGMNAGAGIKPKKSDFAGVKTTAEATAVTPRSNVDVYQDWSLVPAPTQVQAISGNGGGGNSGTSGTSGGGGTGGGGGGASSATAAISGTATVDGLVDFAKGVEGAPYVWGGVNWGDCSGAVSAIANYVTGRAPFGSRFATMTEGSELASRGFQSGLGPSGALNIGWYNGGPYGGHTALTLPNNVNFEMGGSRGDGQYGGSAAGARDSMFTDHAFLPASFFASATGGAGGSDSASSGGTSDSSSGSDSSSSGTSASSEPKQVFSGRDRVKTMFTDIAGIWADSAIEMTGVGEYLDLADRYTIEDSNASTTEASTPSTGQEGKVGNENIIPLVEQAQNFLKGVGLFDTGGVWEPGTFGFNGLNEPELVLKDAHWKVAEGNIAKVDELVGAGVGGGGPRVQITNNNNQIIADQASWQRDQASRDRFALMRYGGN